MTEENRQSDSLTSAVIQVAGMMEIAARTAPKSRGEDFIQIKIITGEQIQELAKATLKFGQERNGKNFGRDSRNLLDSKAVVLLGLKDTKALGLKCGACGHPDCESFNAAKVIDGDFKGPICSYRLIDLGLALGSAVKTAQIFNVDNRIMYRIGVAARWMGMVDWDYVLGVPLAATGKNIFFDR